ncbi:hypothetical protein Hanom_Chr17g01581471 [Helianthus anomalus]
MTSRTYTLFCVVDFWKLAPITLESETRIKAIYKFLEIERTFLLSHPSSSQHFTSKMSGLRIQEEEGFRPPVAAAEGFSYDGLGFMESVSPMTTFLNQSGPSGGS